MAGFQFAEVMGGTYALVDRPDDHRRLTFAVHAHAPSLVRHLRDGKLDLRGTLEMDGFAEEVPCEGTMTMLPLTRKLIRYELQFTGDDGKPYRLIGQKDIDFKKLRASLTTLPASIVDGDGREVATALTRFDLGADLFQFVSSWRPA